MSSTMSPSSKNSKKPAVPLTKVPSVKELCERLGFRHASLKETNTFTDAAHAWRKAYNTSSGISGTELLQWNHQSVQLDLAIMAERFLEDKGNADRFWSPTRDWNQEFEVEYPEDRARIIELLKQLFWKQNRYAANNNAYGHKSVDSRDWSRDKSTPMHQNARTEGTQNSYEVRRDEAPYPGLVPTMPQENGTARLDSARDPDEAVRPSVEKDKDVYEVSDDDSRSVAGKVKKSPAQSSKHPRTEQTAASRDKPPRKRKKTSILQSPKRRTERKAIPRDRPGIVPYVSDDVYEEILKTPSSSEDSDSDAERSQHTAQDDSHTLGASPESIPKRSHSRTPSSNKPYTAPTAPMVVANEMNPPMPTSNGHSRSTEPPKVPSKSQANSLSPRDRLSKVVHRSMTGMARPKLPKQSTASQVQTASTKRVDPNIDKAPNSTPGVSHTKAFASLAPSHPITEANKRSPPTRDSLNPTDSPSHQQPVISQTPEFEANETRNGDPQSLKIGYGGRNSSAENISSKPRSKIQVPLWIITRDPRYTEERWDDGKFQGTLLSDFIEEVSKVTQREHIEKLRLTLRTPTFDTKITVFKDAEDSWVSAKEAFVEKLKEARAEARAKRPNEQASFKILVEPFYEQKAFMSSNVDEDDEEFYF